MKKIIEADVNVCGDLDGPDRLRVEIDIPLAKRIIRLSELVKENHLYKVCEFSYLPEILVVDYDDAGKCFYRPPQTDNELEKCRVECVMLTVKEGSFFWKGLIKHTDTNWNHESIPLSELDDLLIGGPEETNEVNDLTIELEKGTEVLLELVKHICRIGADGIEAPVEYEGHKWEVTVCCPGRNPDAAPQPL